MTSDQLQSRNNKLDALTFHLRGYSTRWIATRFGVVHQTVSVWIRQAKKDEELVRFARQRVEALMKKLEEDDGESGEVLGL